MIFPKLRRGWIMSKSFYEKVLRQNYFFYGLLALLIIIASCYYGTFKAMWFLGVFSVAFLLKVKKIKAKKDELDERLEYITNRALAVGFYFLLGVVFWYYIKEIVTLGKISTRTYVELYVALFAYLGSLIFLKKRY